MQCNGMQGFYISIDWGGLIYLSIYLSFYLSLSLSLSLSIYIYIYIYIDAV